MARFWLKGRGMKPTVLIVDDDLSVLLALSGVLRSEGWKVLQAVNGEEAMERVGEHPEIDVVLLDLNMPRKNGWQVFSELRLGLPLVPVVIITAEPNQFCRAVNMGAAALLEKPLDIPLLLQTIAGLLEEGALEKLARLNALVAETRYGAPRQEQAALSD